MEKQLESNLHEQILSIQILKDVPLLYPYQICTPLRKTRKKQQGTTLYPR